MLRRHPILLTSTHEGVLGTRLSVQVRSDSQRQAAAAERNLVEISRLELIFSVYQPASELWRWRSVPPTDGLEVIASLPEECGCLVVVPGGSTVTNYGWDAARPQRSRGPRAD